MKIKALAPWFGAKRTLAPAIVTELGKHTQYFEPFCGSMAVLMAKEPSQKETVNDLHGDLINLARVIAHKRMGPILYDMLGRSIMSDAAYQDAQAVLDRGDPNELVKQECKIARAYWYFLASWMGRNGRAGTRRIDYQIAVRWTNSGGSPTVRFRNAVDSLPAWHIRLKNVVILSRDAFRILDRFEDSPKTAIYIDPPYYSGSRTGMKAGKSASSEYLHEFSHAETLLEANDHKRLVDVLNSYKKARIVVSYYDCPEIRKLYAGWTFIEHTMNKQLHGQAGRGARKKKAPELLIVNGPSFGR